MKRVVAIGLYVPGTGFTRVFQSIFQYLSSSVEIHWIGIGYTGPELELGYKVYPNNVNGGDAFGAYFAEKLINHVQADALFVLNDFWMLKNYTRLLQNLPDTTKSTAYIPLDGKVVNKEDLCSSAFFDEIVLYTNFALGQTRSALTALFEEGSIAQIPKFSIIPHGIELSSFFRLDRSLAKRLVFPKIPHPEKCIFILNSNRPVERKGVDITIKAFSKARLKTKERTYLVLHHAGINSPQGQACFALVKELGIQEYVLFNPMGDKGYLSDKDLNLLYNACDIGINSSYGEGWGLISFEHAATEAAQIVPAHTSCLELWKKSALLTKTAKQVQFNTTPFGMFEVDVEELAQQILELVENAEQRIHLSVKGRENANQSKYNWKTIASQWSETLFN